MALSTGKSVGRVSIRALPDTKDFRRDLRRQLESIERSSHFTVNVDRADVDKTKLRRSIEAQIATMRGLAIKLDATVTDVKLRKTAIRKKVQEAFDNLGDIRVKIEPELVAKREFRESVRDLVDSNYGKIKLSAELTPTTPTSARLKFLTRTRIVEIIPKLSEAAVAKAAATLAALTGARMSFNWADDLISSLAHLDENLPRITLLTSGLTSLGAVLFSTLGGLVGLGAGVAALLPSLLLVPGLIANGAAGAAVLAVALSTWKEELSSLKGDVDGLAATIRGSFWERARQPFLDLANEILPQVQESVQMLAEGFGDFGAALAKSFGTKLANGRLVAIFASTKKAIDTLTGGTDDFAGAIVSLSEIAARYMDPIAVWLVRQANAFDQWLTAIANDGRLDQWMGDAVDAFYDLGDVAWATIGILQGFWTAAEAGGSEGLAGFADNMLRIRDIVQGPEFQNGLTGIFAGSDVAVKALGEGLSDLLGIFNDLREPIEYFIGQAGITFGNVLSGIADIANQPMVGDGLVDFINGIRDGVQGLFDGIDQEAFGTLVKSILDFAGEMGRAFGPVLADTINAVAPALSDVLDDLSAALPGIADSVSEFAQNDLPGILRSVAEEAPKIADALQDIADTLVILGPAFQTLGQIVSDVIGGIAEIVTGATGALDDFLNLFGAGSGEDSDATKRAQKDWEGLTQFFADWWNAPGPDEDVVRDRLGIPQIDKSLSGLSVSTTESGRVISEFGTKSADSLRENMASGSTSLDGLRTTLGSTGTDVDGLGNKVGVFSSKGQADMMAFQTNVANAWRSHWAGMDRAPLEAANRISASLPSAFGNATSSMFSIGTQMIAGLVNGIRSMAGSVASAAANVVNNAVNAAKAALDINSPSRVVRDQVGKPFSEGLEVGIRSGIGGAQAAARELVGAAVTAGSAVRGVQMQTSASLAVLASGDGPLAGGDTYLQSPITGEMLLVEQRRVARRELSETANRSTAGRRK